MHHELCEGLDFKDCQSCARHVSRYSETVQKATTTRLKPLASRYRCADWKEIATTATDPTQDRL